MAKLSIIVAMSENRVIGRDGQLPWHLSADLRRFKRLTMGHAIIMGRKTYESIGRLLPGRTTIVVTRQLDYEVPGALVAHSLDQALQLAGQDDEAFVIGGAELFQLALPSARRVYLTRVHARVEGDVYFPETDWDQWRTDSKEFAGADERNDFDHTFHVLRRAEAKIGD